MNNNRDWIGRRLRPCTEACSVWRLLADIHGLSCVQHVPIPTTFHAKHNEMKESVDTCITNCLEYSRCSTSSPVHARRQGRWRVS